MTDTSVRCHGCGRRAAPESAECPTCGTNLVTICACGATFPIGNDACPACLAPHLALDYAPGWTLRRKALLVVVVVGIAAGGWLLIQEGRRQPPGRDLEAAHQAFRAERWDEAARLYTHYIETNGPTAQTLYLTAMSLHHQTRFAEADAMMRRAVALNPASLRARTYLAEAALVRGDPFIALEEARRALALDRQEARAHLVAGRALSLPGLRDVERARRHLAQAALAPETAVEARVQLAELTLATQWSLTEWERRREAETVLRDASEQAREHLGDNPGDIDMRVLLARCALARGDLGAAWRHLDGLRSGALPEAARLVEGKLLWLRGDRAEARDVLNELVEGTSGRRLALEIAAFFEDEDVLQIARDVIAAGRLRFPNCVALRLYKARALLQEGAAVDAEEELRATQAMAPRNSVVGLWLADALLAQPGRRRDAETVLRAASRAQDSDPIAALRLADLVLDEPHGADRTADAVVEAERLVADARTRVVPGSPTELYADLIEGKLHLVRREIDAAIATLSAVVARNPEAPVAHLLLSRAHEARGDHEWVVLSLSSAMRAGAATASALARRADAQLRRGPAFAPLAVADAEAALDLDPSNRDAVLSLCRALVRLSPPAIERAEDLLRDVLLDTPDDAGIRLELARLLAASRRLAAAEAEARRAQESATDSVTRLDALALRADLVDARSAERLGPAARQVFVDALSERPDDVECQLRFADLLRDAEDVAAARDVSERALARSPRDPAVLRLAFEIAIADDASRDTARALVERLRDVAPGTAVAEYAAGKLALREGRTDAAVPPLMRAHARAPLDPEVACSLAVAQSGIDDLAAARETLRRAIRRNPDSMPLQLLAADVAYREGRRALDDGRLDAAIGALIDAQGLDEKRLDGSPPRTMAGLAATFLRASSGTDTAWPARAAEESERLLTRLGNAPRTSGDQLGMAYLLRATIADAQGDWTAAADARAAYVRLHPDAAEARRLLAGALFAAGRINEVLPSLEAALQDDPESWTTALTLAGARDAAGAPAEALVVIDDWLSRHPDDARAHAVRGRLQVSLGDDQAAIAALSDAVRLRPEALGAALALSDLLAKTSGRDSAIALLRDLGRRSGGRAELRFELGRVLLGADPRSTEGRDLVVAAYRDGMESDAYEVAAAGTLLDALLAERDLATALEIADVFLERHITDVALAADQTVAGPRARAFALAGIAFERTSHVVRAAMCYRTALAFRPDDASVMNHLAEVIASDAGRRSPRELTAAVDLARRAVSLRSDRPEYRATLALTLGAAGHHREADDIYDLLLAELRDAADAVPAVRPILSGSLIRAADVRAALGRPDESLRLLDEAVGVDPEIARDKTFRRVSRGLRR